MKDVKDIHFFKTSEDENLIITGIYFLYIKRNSIGFLINSLYTLSGDLFFKYNWHQSMFYKHNTR